ncbi:MAG: adenosylcobinamide-GDP ribazoletransferase [Anaeromyxobacteraceae bacterium]
MKRLAVAVAFLTAIPLRVEAEARDVGRAALCFPVVGAALGALLAAVGMLLGRALPAPLVAVLVVAAGALATGALHLDGLADTADGFGGGRDAEHALRIMKDHAVGAYGATALVLALLVKAAALHALLAGGAAFTWLPIAGALSRWVTVPLARLPSARGSGLGASVSRHVGDVEVGGATAIALAVSLGVGGLRGAVAALAAFLFAVAFGALCRRRIGGVTGDTLGAAAEIAEALVLVVGVGSGAP